MIPIYEAEQKGDEEIIRGFYVKVAQFHTIIPYNDSMITIGSDLEFSAMELCDEVIEIKIETLKISFDNSNNSSLNIFCNNKYLSLFKYLIEMVILKSSDNNN